MKKAIIILSLVIAIMVSGCSGEVPEVPNNNSNNITTPNNISNNISINETPSKNSSSGPEEELHTILIGDEGSFSEEECEKRDFQDKVLMLESKYCGACQYTMPTFKEVCAEKEINPVILDLSTSEARKELASYWVEIRYTPTFIFGCDYYIGAKTEAEYSRLLDKFLEAQK